MTAEDNPKTHPRTGVVNRIALHDHHHHKVGEKEEVEEALEEALFQVSRCLRLALLGRPVLLVRGLVHVGCTGGCVCMGVRVCLRARKRVRVSGRQ